MSQCPTTVAECFLFKSGLCFTEWDNDKRLIAGLSVFLAYRLLSIIKGSQGKSSGRWLKQSGIPPVGLSSYLSFIVPPLLPRNGTNSGLDTCSWTNYWENTPQACWRRKCLSWDFLLPGVSGLFQVSKHLPRHCVSLT